VKVVTQILIVLDFGAFIIFVGLQPYTVAMDTVIAVKITEVVQLTVSARIDQTVRYALRIGNVLLETALMVFVVKQAKHAVIVARTVGLELFAVQLVSAKYKP
jgi:hypothetical protein